MNDNKSRKIAEHLSDVMLSKEPRNKDAFEEWVTNNPSATDVLNDLSEPAILKEELSRYGKKNKESGAKKMIKKIERQQMRRTITKLTSIAAALMIVSFVIWTYNRGEVTPTTKNSIAEAENNANVKIILENGDIVTLNSDEETIRTEQILIRKTGTKEVSFVAEESDSISINRLVVPRREKFAITLPDGTKVTLNAESELIFPSKFTDNKREVTINGEGYFEVAKDKKIPFIVKTHDVAIQVYGTKFNVKSYNKSAIETFLMEGSVGVSVSKKPQQMLKPNQIITINDLTDSSTIENVRQADKYIGWMDNNFIFEADSIDKVMMDLSRWYNVKLELKNSATLDILITGSFRRDMNLDEIIETLEILSGVKLIKKDVK